jgi:hypothetical protein
LLISIHWRIKLWLLRTESTKKFMEDLLTLMAPTSSRTDLWCLQFLTGRTAIKLILTRPMRRKEWMFLEMQLTQIKSMSN